MRYLVRSYENGVANSTPLFDSRVCESKLKHTSSSCRIKDKQIYKDKKVE